MNDDDCNNDQTEPRVTKCLDVPLSLTPSDERFMRRSEIKLYLSSYSACYSEMETESAADYEPVSE